ncbi:putative molybdenum carrier protein [Prosthecochloris sp. HL-130-GSB]|uniref:putative molybdenum carrier protein n=1 Tax=Prosthecochloris sp. HL-130-GSB TaxID=1974213 RepID=UPI000A1C0DCD|nr:putative molybdenum carrier protein [Prosthecochloris sp. HL-130-GSB]ARM30433.1 hypothetical protein B9H02_02690 [Prosthecochloris sp. HL-130-GSB]
MGFSIQKIISGGQTGVDRAALDFAISRGIDHGGWCPKGRRAEDGPISPVYRLKETASSKYEERTALNVRDSDATLIVAGGVLTGGTKLTWKLASAEAKSFFVVDPATPSAAREAASWLSATKPSILNIAGPRASTDPAIYRQTMTFLEKMLKLI